MKKNVLEENETKTLQSQLDLLRGGKSQFNYPSVSDLTGDDNSMNATCRNLEEKFSSEAKIEEEETFISKEAAEILKEFKNRSHSIINTTRS